MSLAAANSKRAFHWLTYRVNFFIRHFRVANSNEPRIETKQSPSACISISTDRNSCFICGRIGRNKKKNWNYKMVRKLKYHEEKLLKKVDFMNWQVDNNLHEAKVLRKYHVRKREDYTKWVKTSFISCNSFGFHISFHNEIFRYNKLSRTIRELATRISEIDAKDPFRTEMSAMLLEKLYVIGLIPTKWDLNNAINISASTFCRRRLPVVMVRSKRSVTSSGAQKILIRIDFLCR